MEPADEIHIIAYAPGNLLGDVQLNGNINDDDAFDTLQEVSYAATFLYHDGSTTPKFSKLQKNLADIKIDADRAKEWIKSGAQPTDTVRALLKKVDVL